MDPTGKIQRMRALRWGALILVAVALGAVAFAQDTFLGFDPSSFNGEMLSSSTLHQMVAAAEKVAPPRNGKNYVFAFANLERDISFTIKVEDSIKANAKAAGIDLVVANNNLSGPTGLANAKSFVQRNVDFVIEFQTDANFGPVIMKQFNDAHIPVIAIDIPMAGATFFGANNPKSGYLAGSYLGQAAIAKWGIDKVKQGYFVNGALPQSGAIPALRTEGEDAGFLASVPGFPKSHIIEFDSKNTQDTSFTQMSNVLSRIPSGVPIMGTAINDQATTGMLQAVKSANRISDAIFVGMGADKLDTLVSEPAFLASVAYFPERYGNYLIPTALMMLAGKTVPPAVLVHHVVITPMNVCKYYSSQSCTTPAGYPSFTYSFPQSQFSSFLTKIRQESKYKAYLSIIPKP